MTSRCYCQKSNWYSYIPNPGEISNLHITQIADELKKPKFISNLTHMQHSDVFPNEEFDVFLNEYYCNYHKNYKDIIKQKYEQYKSNIEWLRICNTKMIIDHIYTTCKLQLTARSQLEAESSIFIPLDISKTESAIEIFANSIATFKNCHFSDANRTALFARDYSTAIFDHCTFEGNKISCFIMNGSYAKFVDCKFKNDKTVSVFVTKDSQCEMINCEFIDLEGKAIFVNNSSVAKITDSNCINCQNGAATIAKKSKLMINNMTIKGSNSTALRAIDSVMNVVGVNISNTVGNAVNIENSTGYFIDCNFNETFHPTICVLGNKSNPIFHNCNITENMDTFGVICNNRSRPLFDNCYFANCTKSCFSISDFSRPHIQNCSFKDIDRYFMNVFSGSCLTIYNIKTGDIMINLDEKINIWQSANCQYKSLNKVIIYDNIVDINKIEDDDDNDDDDIHCKTLISPTYIMPEKMVEMEVPEIIKNGKLKYLKLTNSYRIIKQLEHINTSLICTNCHKEMKEGNEPYIFTSCCHFVCKECKGIKKCPVCEIPVNGIQKIYFEEKCALCLDHKPNTISLPCGHLCMCYECSVQNSLYNFKCPMCNKPVGGYKFLFDDISTKHSNFNLKNKEIVASNDIIIENDYDKLGHNLLIKTSNSYPLDLNNNTEKIFN